MYVTFVLSSLLLRTPPGILGPHYFCLGRRLEPSSAVSILISYIYTVTPSPPQNTPANTPRPLIRPPPRPPRPNPTPHSPKPISRLRRHYPLDRRPPLRPLHLLPTAPPPQHNPGSSCAPQRPFPPVPYKPLKTTLSIPRLSSARLSNSDCGAGYGLACRSSRSSDLHAAAVKRVESGADVE